MIFSSIKKYSLTLRIHHWLKNLLVFSPLILAHQFDYDSIYMAVNAFICFCLTASLIYIINDLRDIKFDQLHSTKSLRPIASGSISKSSIFILIIILSILSIVLSLNINANFSLILLSYFILTLLYTYGLKKIIYIDLIILTSFYIIRIIAGGFAADIAVTAWFITFSFFIFLFLATIKRITEIQKYIDLTRQRMIKYNMVKNLESFERILRKPRKEDSKPTSRPRQKKVDLWKMYKMTK